MEYKKINIDDLLYLRDIVGDNYVFTEEEKLFSYSHDETEDLSFPPEVVVQPSNVNQVAAIIKYCNEKSISITPCGARTGLSGGSLPVFGGIALSIERLNSIVEIDERNLQATVEPGVINQVFREAVEKKGLFYPPDPASKGSCFLGGNIAENAGGPKALKYGVTKDYVLNLEVVLPTGDIIWTGANVLKNSTGYNLTQLMIGSEGTLAVITKAVVRLLPLPTHRMLLLVPFEIDIEACDTVNEILSNEIIPSALEFMEKDAIIFVRDHNYADIPFILTREISSYLLIELDGNNRENLFSDAEKIYEILKKYKCGEVILADSPLEQERIWKVRRSIGLAVKAFSTYKEEDTVVPRGHLVDLLVGVKKIGKKYNFKSICYGHAGDGNLHVNILKEGLTDFQWGHILKQAIREIFELCVKLGGTISGEHGIGYVQKDYMDIPFSIVNLELQKKIKSLFDPKHILNPGKVFDNK